MKKLIYAGLLIGLCGCFSTRVYLNDRRYKYVQGTEYTISVPRDKSPSIDISRLNERFKVLMVASQKTGKSIEEICYEVDENKNFDIEGNEYSKILLMTNPLNVKLKH